MSSFWRYISDKIAPYLQPPVEVLDEEELCQPVQIHDYIIIRPGENQVILDRYQLTPEKLWLILDLSDFGFGLLRIKVRLIYPNQKEITYLDRKLESGQIGGLAWDLQLPPANGVKIELELSSGRQTRIDFHLLGTEVM